MVKNIHYYKLKDVHKNFKYLFKLLKYTKYERKNLLKIIVRLNNYPHKPKLLIT